MSIYQTPCRDKKSVIVAFNDAQYIASTRHIRIEGLTCPDLDPKKLLPNDPDGARAIGGIHNRHDPVLRMLLSCETVPSLVNQTSCSHHPNIDLFVWQPDFAFYTHGTLSFYTWIHDYVSPLLHAVHMSNSTVATERALVVIHHSHKHRHPGKHHSSLGGGRRAILASLFGGGVYTLGSQEDIPMMPQDDCMRVRRLILGAGHTINMQDLVTKRHSIQLLREAGFKAAGIEEPVSLHESNHRQAMHILAPHQHRFVHHHHHNKHHLLNPEKDNSFMMERFDVLEEAYAKRNLRWQSCCHLHDLKQNPEYEERDRTTTKKALREAITTASRSTFFVASNTPGMVYCLWGPEGAGTVEFSPTGPHDGTHFWKLCGWALNGSYVKVSVPRPTPQQLNATNSTDHLIERTANCSMVLLTSTLNHEKPSKQLPKYCRTTPEDEDEALLCPSAYRYETHRFNASLGDLCRGKSGRFVCPRGCSSSTTPFQCTVGVDLVEGSTGDLPCRAAQAMSDKAKLANSGSIIGAAYWNPSGALEGDRIAPEWHNGNIQVIPDHPKPYRKGAFKPVGREVAHQRGCYQTLASARIHKAMWCPQGAGDMTAG